MTNIIIGFAEDSGNVTLTGGITGQRETSNVNIEVIDDSLNLSGSIKIRPSEKILLENLYGTLTLDGSLLITHQQGNVFVDFASFPVGNIDPAVGSLQTKVSGAAFDAGQPSNFRRVSLVAQVAEDSTYGKRVAFVAPGVRVNAMASGNRVHVDAAQVEQARANGVVPSAYSPARSLQIGVRPDRLNLLTDPASDVTPYTTNGVQWTVARDATVFRSKTGSTKSTLAQASTAVLSVYRAGPGGLTDYRVTPGRVYTFSIYTRASAADRVGRVELSWRLADGSFLSVAQGANIPVPTEGWARMNVTATAPAGAFAVLAGATVETANLSNATLGESAWIADGLLEQSATAGDYFDGDGGADYLWEQGTTKGRAFYYKDYAARAYLLKQTIAENCPLGVIPAEPQFAVLPKI